MRSTPSYGVRSRRGTANAGIRPTARTYGKARIGTYAEKADGHITVESDPERLVSHLLSIDPRVRSFKPQPFTVDLVFERMLFTAEDRTEAREARGGRDGAVEYTPDFAVVQSNGLQAAYEVKLEGFEGDSQYWAKLERAQFIMEANCYPLATVVVPADERHPVLVNAQLLKSAASRAAAYLTPDIIERVECYCEAGSVLQRALCEDLQITPSFIPLLLVTGVLRADLAHHHICSKLELSLAYGDLSHLCLIEELRP
ncbi:hypothetical protein [Caballeronia sp. NCTM1]|uniref:hypothetical protein n=1 Tax=Caballeronia sp. NCTM1 TaxID=2921753 RepID=UPI002027BB81|nr:hypothetical protein [Caballeronia sp. NCTM1]